MGSKEVECGREDIGLEAFLEELAILEVTAGSAGLGNSVKVDNLLAWAVQDILA